MVLISLEGNSPENDVKNESLDFFISFFSVVYIKNILIYCKILKLKIISVL